MTIIERIQNRIKVDQETGCWVWQGSVLKDGYGQLKVNGRCKQTHRLMYEAAHGRIPDNMQCCHKCDNPPCCNPDHLFIGTTRDNQRDAATKGRKATGDRHGTHTHPEVYRGERNRNARLTEAAVREIRQEYAKGGISTTKLGSRYGVCHATVCRIIRRETWRHV